MNMPDKSFYFKTYFFIILFFLFLSRDISLCQTPDEGLSLLKEGDELYNKFDYYSSLDKYEKSLEIFKKNNFDEGISLSLNGIGNVYKNLGDYKKALNYYTDSLQVKRKTGDMKGEGNCLNNIAGVYNNLGDYQKALSYYTESLQVKKKIADLEGAGTCLNNMAGVYDNLGDYRKALDYYSDALEINRKTGSINSEGSCLNNIGLVYSSLGDYERSLDYYAQSLELARKAGSPRGEGICLNNIGLVYSSLGDYEKALDYYTQSLKIKKKTGLPCDITEGNMGDIYLSEGQPEKAFELFNQIKDTVRLGRYYLIKKNYTQAKDEFIKKLSEYEKQRNADRLFCLYTGLGLAEEGLENYEEAKGYYLKAVDLIEEQRNSLNFFQRKNYFQGKIYSFGRLEPYEGLVRVYHYLNNDDEGFLYSESTKARLFSEDIARKYEGSDCRIPEAVALEEREIINLIASLYKQMEIAEEKDNYDRIVELNRELKGMKEKQEIFIKKLRQIYPEYASIMYPKPLMAEEIKLNSDEVLIEYEVTERETLAYLIKNKGIVKTVDVRISREELVNLITSYRGAFEDVKNLSDFSRFNPETGKKLFDLLLKDLLSEVKNEKIVIIPDDILCILPFEALVTEINNFHMKDGKYGPYPEGVKYTGDLYSITYYQSASALTVTENLYKGGGKKGLFAAGDPVFSEHDERIEHKNSPEDPFLLSFQSALTDGGYFSFQRLPATGELINSLSVIFSGNIDSMTGFDATETNVKSKKLDDYKYLLFATHGILNNDVPYIKEPALVMTLVNNPEGEDGFLTMGEVMNINMGAEISVLSACKTGLGKNLRGEGVMGMGRAFQYSGVKSVLISLWSVEAVSTNIMIEKYFEYLKEGAGSREALRKARAYIRKEGYEHPIFWASFILVGN